MGLVQTSLFRALKWGNYPPPAVAQTASLTHFALHSAEASLSVGYSPFLNFQVQDFDETMYRLVEHGARMDGAVKYNPTGKVSALTSDEGWRL